MFTQLSLPTIERADLVGRWHIVRTNFPMWLAGDKTRPCLTYGVIEDDASALSDLVTFEKAGEQKTIRGIDRQDPQLSCHFTWRGRGLLKLLRSDWYVIDLSHDAGVAAIYFEKTLFTPAGLDIVSRAPVPDGNAVAACIERIRAEALVSQHVNTLEAIVDT